VAGNAGAIEGCGAEAVIADPDRVGTLAPALAGVSVVCVLLGSARGSPEALAALHGDRLAMLLTQVIDTPVRGFVYDAAGSVDAPVLKAGAASVSSFCTRSRIPFSLLSGDGSGASWEVRAADAVDRVLTPS
jgi:hypothetical protein